MNPEIEKHESHQKIERCQTLFKCAALKIKKDERMKTVGREHPRKESVQNHVAKKPWRKKMGPKNQKCQRSQVAEKMRPHEKRLR